MAAAETGPAGSEAQAGSAAGQAETEVRQETSGCHRQSETAAGRSVRR